MKKIIRIVIWHLKKDLFEYILRIKNLLKLKTQRIKV